MKSSVIWSVLGISETKDMAVIKNAYRDKLVTVNPEENQEGFMKLRTAYEEAIRFAKDQVKLIITEEISPIDAWINEVKNIYFSFNKRRNKEYWEDILRKDICINLDTSDAVRDALLDFLTKNYRLPNDIWKLLDERFKLIEYKQELFEKFPSNFIKFVIDSIENEGIINYYLFEGNEDGDLDGFISLYYEIRRKIDFEAYEGLEDDFKDIDTFSIFHPCLEIEKMRFALYNQEIDMVNKIMKQLEEMFLVDQYILYYIAETKWSLKDYEGAYEYYNHLLKINQDHYSAILGMGKYYYLIKEYENAKEYLMIILQQNSNESEAVELVTKVNEHLIEKLNKDYLQDPDNQELAIEIGGCYFQNYRLSECISFLNKITPTAETKVRYHKLKGRAYLAMGEYENALKELLIAVDEIHSLEDCTDNTKKQKRHLDFVYLLVGEAYEGIGYESGEQHYYEKALDYYKRAADEDVDLNDKLLYYYRQACTLFKIKSYEECVDICSIIISHDETYYNAFLCRQDAYYHLKYSGDVIDDYYNCINLYPEYVKPYILAAKVYYSYKHYEDVLDVVKTAKEYSLYSNELEFYHIKALRCMAKTEEEKKEICTLFENLIQNLYNEDNDIEDITSVYLVTAQVYMDCELYEKALEVYEKLEKEFPDNCNILYEKGEYYRIRAEREKALHLYEKVLGINPNHRFANSDIADIYKRKFEKSEKREDLEKAIFYLTKQIEIYPHEYYYNSRGLLYLEVFQLDRGLDDFFKALEMNPNYMWSYNNAGYTYKLKGEYEKAKEMYEKASQYAEEKQSPLPYGNLGILYTIFEEYDKALSYYEKNVSLFPDNLDCCDDISEILRRMGRHNEAIANYQHIIDNIPDANEAYFYNEMANCYFEMEEYSLAETYYKKVLEENPNDEDAYKDLGFLYLYQEKAFEKSLDCYKKAFEIDSRENDEKDLEIYTRIIEIYMKLNNKIEAEKYFNLAMKNVDLDKYLECSGYQPVRYYVVGCLCYHMGYLEKAEYYFSKIEEFPKCKQCKYKACFEAMIGKALICEGKDKYEEAIEHYKQALEVNVNETICKYKIEELRKKRKR